MNPELAKRLRRFGETVDQAAVSAGAPVGPPRDAAFAEGADPLAELDDHDDLEPVTSITGWRHRHYRKIVAAAAALVIVVAGALLTARLTGSPESGTAASTDVPGVVDDSTEPGATNEPKTTVAPAATATTNPAMRPTTSAPLAAGSSTASSSTTASTTTSSTTTTTRPTAPSACPDGYNANSRYPLRLCNRGPAVALVQARLGVNADGFFGPSTRQAVRDFQGANGLAVDGLVGPDTWSALGLNAAGTDGDNDGLIDPDEMG